MSDAVNIAVHVVRGPPPSGPRRAFEDPRACARWIIFDRKDKLEVAKYIYETVANPEGVPPLLDASGNPLTIKGGVIGGEGGDDSGMEFVFHEQVLFEDAHIQQMKTHTSSSRARRRLCVLCFLPRRVRQDSP